METKSFYGKDKVDFPYPLFLREIEKKKEIDLQKEAVRLTYENYYFQRWILESGFNTKLPSNFREI